MLRSHAKTSLSLNARRTNFSGWLYIIFHGVAYASYKPDSDTVLDMTMCVLGSRISCGGLELRVPLATRHGDSDFTPTPRS